MKDDVSNISDIKMSAAICGGVTLLGAMMLIGGSTPTIMVGGIMVIAAAIFAYALVNNSF